MRAPSKLRLCIAFFNLFLASFSLDSHFLDPRTICLLVRRKLTRWSVREALRVRGRQQNWSTVFSSNFAHALTFEWWLIAHSHKVIGCHVHGGKRKWDGLQQLAVPSSLLGVASRLLVMSTGPCRHWAKRSKLTPMSYAYVDCLLINILPSTTRPGASWKGCKERPQAGPGRALQRREHPTKRYRGSCHVGRHELFLIH